MLGHPALILGGVVVGAIAAIVAVGISRFNAWEQQQRHRQEYRPREPDGPRIVGTCGKCEGDVTTFSGYTVDCGHYWHYTCSAEITRKFQDAIQSKKFNWSQVCGRCLRQRMETHENLRVRNRRPDHLHCAECLREFDRGEEEIHEFDCGHRIHIECLRRLLESGLSTCSMCMEAL